ncbi:MAG: AAA family ATPase [Solirubrobacterales bacterium]
MTATNPFRFGALALDQAFADREPELGELVADVLNGQDVVILAPRRYGKSSLVWRATQRLVSERVLVAQVDLMTTPTKEKLAERLAGSIYENIASTLERVRDRALAPFRGLRIQPTVTVNPEDGSFSFSFSASQRSADIDATLERLLALPAELGSAKERRVAMVIDEFQEIVDLDPNLPKLLRAVFQQQPEVAHVYLGSKRHIMERIFNDENEPFWRSAKPIEIGRIDADAFGAFITERFRSAGKRIDPATAAEALGRTRGHPYATQELCYFLWEEADPGEEASEAELNRALPAVLRSEHAHFTLLWDGATPPQRLLLQALSREQPGHPFRNEYRSTHGLPAPSALQRAARGLVERELLEKEGGAYLISEPFLAEWISANISQTPEGTA